MGPRRRAKARHTRCFQPAHHASRPDSAEQLRTRRASRRAAPVGLALRRPRGGREGPARIRRPARVEVVLPAPRHTAGRLAAPSRAPRPDAGSQQPPQAPRRADGADDDGSRRHPLDAQGASGHEVGRHAGQARPDARADPAPLLDARRGRRTVARAPSGGAETRSSIPMRCRRRWSRELSSPKSSATSGKRRSSVSTPFRPSWSARGTPSRGPKRPRYFAGCSGSSVRDRRAGQQSTSRVEVNTKTRQIGRFLVFV